jgi:glycosyltransferase involved in cell wall biosynthesis
MVSPLFHPNLGGVGKQAIALTEYLCRSGTKIFVICRNLKGVAEWDPVPGLIIKSVGTLWPAQHDLDAKSVKNVLISLSFCFNLLRELIKSRKDYDIVHFHGSSLQLIFSVLPLKLMKKKIVAKVTGAKADREAGSFKGRYFFMGDLFIRILKKVDVFIAVSNEISYDLIQDGFDSKKIFKTTNFIIPDNFYPERSAEKRNEIKSRLGIDIDKRIITFSGRLVPLKRVDVLLQAIQGVLKSRKDIQALILGHGELLESLKRMASDFGIDAFVSFKNSVPNILDYLQITDIFVFPSEKEGMPNALLEAMACRLPVIAARIGGVVDIIRDGENGLIVTPGNAEELKETILMLIGDVALEKKIAENAYNDIKENYYINKIADKYMQLYGSMMSEV